MKRRTNRRFCLQWLKIFALIVAGGVLIGLLSNMFLPQPAYAKIAAMNIIEAKEAQRYDAYLRNDTE